ncbi:MAG: hypothetical protein AAB152_11345 [Candidatus Coatesbacteria bacterium]
MHRIAVLCLAGLLLARPAAAAPSLSSADPEEVKRAVAKFQKLEKVEQDQKLSDLIDRLGHADEAKQVEAETALRNLGDLAVPALVGALKVRRGRPPQRARMVAVLGTSAGRGSPATQAAVLDALAWVLTEEAPVGSAAGEELFKAGEAAVPLLAKKVEAGADGEKVESLKLLGRLGAAASPAIPAMTGLLTSSAASATAKDQALAVLEPLWGAEMTVPKELCDGLQDPASRSRLLRFYETRNPGECLEPLARLLPAAEPADQVRILRSLGKAGAPGLAFVLDMDKVATASAAPAVASEAAKTIQWLMGQAGAPELPLVADALQKGTPPTRKEAAAAAGRIGAAAAGLVARLVANLKPGNEALETEVLKSLEAIGTTAAVDAAKTYLGRQEIQKNIALLASPNRAEVLGAVQGLLPHGKAAWAAVPALEALFAGDDSAVSREDTAALYGALARTLRAIGTRDALAVLKKYRKAVIFYEAEILDSDKLARLKRDLWEQKAYGEGTLWSFMEQKDDTYRALSEFEKKRFRTTHGAEIARRQAEGRSASWAVVIPVKFEDAKYSFKEKRFNLDAFEELTWGEDTVRFDRTVTIPPVLADETDAEELVKGGREATVTVVFRKARYYSRAVPKGPAVSGVTGEVIAVRCEIPGRPPSVRYFGAD